MFTGAAGVGFTVDPGVRLHVAPAMPVVHETVTLWLNDPAAVIWKLTGGEVFPRFTITLAGDGVVNPKLSRCRVTGTVWVMWLVSDPTAFTLKL
jgi:hypothetical protein